MKLIKVYIKIILLYFSLCHINILFHKNDFTPEFMSNSFLKNFGIDIRNAKPKQKGGFLAWKLKNVQPFLNHEIVSQCIKVITGKVYIMLYNISLPNQGILPISDNIGCSQILRLEEAKALLKEADLLNRLADTNNNFLYAKGFVSAGDILKSYGEIFDVIFKGSDVNEKIFVLYNIAYILKNLKDQNLKSYKDKFHNLYKAQTLQLPPSSKGIKVSLDLYIKFTYQHLRSDFKLKDALALTKTFPDIFKNDQLLIKQKVEMLVQLSKFNEALTLLDDPTEPYMLLLKAYVYIKNYQLSEAKEILENENNLTGLLDYYVYKTELFIHLDEKQNALDLIKGIKKEHFPKSKSLLNKLIGHIYSHFEDYQTALKFYKIAEKLDDTDFELKPLIGLTHVYLKDYKSAGDVFNDENLLLNYEIRPAVLNYSGYASLRQGSIPEAIKKFNEAKKINPDDNLSLYYKGLVYFYTDDQKEIEDSINSLDELLEKQQNNREALIAKAYILLDKRKPEETLITLQKLKNIRNSEVKCCYGDIAFMQAIQPTQPIQATQFENIGYKKAANYYKEAIALNSFIKKYYLKLGKALLKVPGDSEDSIVYFYKALNMHIQITYFGEKPTVQGGAEIIADFFLNEYNVDTSLTINKKERLYETEININQDLFDYYLSVGAPSKTLDENILKNKVISLNIALKINNNSAEAHKFKVLALLLLKNQDKEILSHYEKFSKLGGSDYEFEKKLINYFLSNGNCEGATIHYNKTVSLQGKDLGIEKQVGDCFYNIKDEDAAIKYYRMFKELGGINDDVDERMRNYFNKYMMYANELSKLNPADMDMEKMLGDYFYNIKDFNTAIKYYRMFKELGGMNSDVEEKMRDYYSHIKYINGLSKNDSADKDMEKMLGDFYAIGEWNEASAHYEKFFKLGGEDKDLRKVLGDFYNNSNQLEKAVPHYFEFMRNGGYDEGVEKILNDYYDKHGYFNYIQYIKSLNNINNIGKKRLRKAKRFSKA
jgi:hypothetical protein